MYKILSVEDKIRVPPLKFDLSLEEAVKSSLEERWTGLIQRDVGVILAMVAVDNVGEGKILPGDGAIHYPVKFKMLVYKPELHELVKGNIIDVTEFGVFIRLGPLDGMVHVSQLMDDFVSYDQKRAVFVGRDSKRIMKEGDSVVARIISVSVDNNQYKIGLTTRQTGLGVVGWPKYERVKRASLKDEERPRRKKR